MLSVTEARSRIAVVVPVYFNPDVSRETILPILEGVFRDSSLFCRPENLLAVVDQDTVAEQILSDPPAGSELKGISWHRLEENRAKAGAVNEGLQRLLEVSNAEYFVTRDCDGDHILEDIPRMISMAVDVQTSAGQDLVAVMGGRPSLEKPMGWLRQEWEFLTNTVMVDLVSFALARQGRVIDRKFWNGLTPDVQSGYRVYSRSAAERTVRSLSSLPDRREVRMLACEPVPFGDLILEGAIFAQVNRLTLVEQPVSSYSRVDFGENYGHLVSFLGDRYEIPREVLVQIVDNAMVSRSIYFTDSRSQLLEFRDLIAPGEAPPNLPGFV
jgi:hypothetical protein